MQHPRPCRSTTSVAALVLGWVAAVTFGPVALSQAHASAPPIRVGGTLSATGKYQEPSEMLRAGYRLWAHQINESGGLLGRQVELILYDDESRADRVRELYGRLLDDDRVDLLLSPYGSPLTVAASEVSEARGRVLLASAAASESLWTRGTRYLFGIYATAERYFIGLLDLMARRGMHSVALLHEGGMFHDEIKTGVETWVGKFRLKIPLERKISTDPEVLRRALADLAALSPPADGLIISAYPEGAHQLLGLMKQGGVRPNVLALTIVPIHPDFYDLYGVWTEGIFGPSQWEPDERIPFPGTRDFVREFQRFAGRAPSYHAGSAYATCQVLERAVTSTAALDHEKIRDFIATLDTVTVIGRFKVDGRGMQVGHNPILIQWQQGRKEIVYPTKMQTSPARF